MTATAPPGGTQDPEPTPGPGPTPGPTPAAAPTPAPAPAPPAGAGGQPPEDLRSIIYEGLGANPSDPPRRKRRVLMVSLTGIALTLLIGVVIAYFQIGPSVSKENDSQKEYDASQLPFSASVQPEKSEPNEWAMVLDRELTAAETRKMTSTQDSSAVFSYLRGLGGRPLAFAPFLENAPKRYKQEQSSSGRMELSDVHKLNLLSTRAYGVVVDDWQVTGVTCEKSTAKTVVSYPPQGGAAYQGIRFHIPPRADEPVLTDDTEGQGESYFSTQRIEVGGGQSSGGLRMETIAPPGQSCEWGIKVHYVDAHQKEQFVQLKDGKGKPFRLRTESVPANPAQKWVFGSVPWTACHLKPEGDLCELL